MSTTVETVPEQQQQLSVFELENKLRNAKAELMSADIEFRDVVDGVSRALGSSTTDLPPELEEGDSTATSIEEGDSHAQALAAYLMNQLRDAADRHRRAAELVNPEDISYLKQKLAQEEAAWVGEGGDDFSEFLRSTDFQPQPKASLPQQSDEDDDDEGSEEGKTNFSALDKIHDIVLGIREDEIRCFFSGDDGESDAEGAGASSLTLGTAKMSLETLRHMAEFSEDELPIFSTGNSDRRQIGQLQADIIPLAEDGSFPPFEDQDMNPFVNSPDELIGRKIRFAIRVRGIKFTNGDSNEEGADDDDQAVARSLQAALKDHCLVNGAKYDEEKPPAFFVRYKITPHNLLLPNGAETHKSVESGSSLSAIQSINHVEEWTHHEVDETFLDQLTEAAQIQFEIVMCPATSPEEEEAARKIRQQEKEIQKEQAARDRENKTLKELLELRSDKHVDLKRRLEAEILREITETQKQQEEEQQFVAEFRSAFNEDMKHLKRTTDKLREMLKEGIHHKSRGTAKQMTAEHALRLKETRDALRRRHEEKVYSKTLAANRVRALELENLKSEIQNLRKVKAATCSMLDEKEKLAEEEAKETETRHKAAVEVRDKLQKELQEISKLRSDVNLRHVQARKTLFDQHHNEHVKKQHDDAVKRLISNSVARSSQPGSTTSIPSVHASTNRRSRPGMVMSPSQSQNASQQL